MLLNIIHPAYNNHLKLKQLHPIPQWYVGTKSRKFPIQQQLLQIHAGTTLVAKVKANYKQNLTSKHKIHIKDFPKCTENYIIFCLSG